MDRLDLHINVSAALIQDIRIRPLYRGKLPKGLTGAAARLLEMAEADRVVKLLQQARTLIREADELVASEQTPDAAGRGVAKAIDSVLALLAAVTDRHGMHDGRAHPPLTRDALRSLLADVDDLLRGAIQAQRGIGIDAGTPSAALRQASDDKIRLVRDVLGKVPIRSRPQR